MLTVATAAFVAMVCLAQRRADTLITPAYDRAIFMQLAWNLGRGAGFTSSLERANYLGVHFSPLLAATAPLTWIWPDPSVLDVANAFALAAAGPAAYLFIRQLLVGLAGRDLAAAALAAPLPFWAAVQWAGRSGFHPEALALPVALVAAWAGVSGRRCTLWVAALLALSAKEDQAYTLVAVGLLTWARGPAAMRRHGQALVGLGAVWALVAMGIVMPVIRWGTPANPTSYYIWLLHPDAASLVAALTHPAAWLAGLALLLGMAGLPLLRPRWLLLAAPPFIADVLSSHYPQNELKLHYGLLVVVPVVIAGALGAQRLLGRRRLPAVATACLAVPALAAGYLLGPLTPIELQWTAALGREPGLQRLRADRSTIPPEAPVSADDGLAAELSARPVLRVFPDAAASDYLVIDRQALLHGYIDAELREQRLADLAASGRRLIRDDGRFQVWSPVGG